MAGFDRRRLRSKKEIQINEKNTRVRWILALVFFLIGVIFLAIGVGSCQQMEPGWQKITANTGEPNCGGDMIFNYYFSGESDQMKEANQHITQLYTEGVVEAYKLFSADASVDGGGLAAVNSHVNETVTVDEALYQALSLIQESGNRQIYMAPVLVEYRHVLNSEAESLAGEKDPARNPELVPYISQLAGFANDPEMIDIQLLGSNQVQLTVSQAYLRFAEENGIEVFLDLDWMFNAFAVDYLAQKLVDHGYTKGYISSLDGYTRNMDTSGEIYHINIFDRLENDIYIPASLSYAKPTAIVFLHNYPLAQQDAYRYYVFSDGKVVSTMVSPEDGMCKSATDNIMACSESAGCAEMVLQLSPIYLAEELDEAKLTALQNQGISCIWFAGTALRYTGNLQITLLQQEGVPAYTGSKVS